ncbi:MAG TPA: hypothetical protein VFU74_00615 [Actinocrinis sp.]|nr:hypothetical protein [Actinocrinis sp.]
MRSQCSEPASRLPINGRRGDFLRRTVAAITIAAGALAAALLAGPATAQSADCEPGTVGSIYPVTDCMAMTSTNFIGLGGSLIVSGEGFRPLSAVSAQLHSTPVSLGSFTSDASGSVDGSVKIPDSVAVGTHELELTGLNADGMPRLLTATVQIGSKSVSSSGMSGWFWVGIGLLVAVLMVIAALVARSGRQGRQAG